MSNDLESMWGAMKGVHYDRTMATLRERVHSAQDLQEGLTLALDTINTAVHAVAGTFWIYDKYRDGRIRPKAVYGGGDLGGISLLPGEGIAGQVIKTGESVIVMDCQSDPRWAGRVDGKTGFQTKSMICVALTVEDTTFGCIQIINRTDDLLFDEMDMELAQHLAESTTKLFQENGFLDEFREGQQRESGRGGAVTFAQIFTASSEREMEVHLRRVAEFSTLRVTEQEEVLKMAKSMYTYFAPKKKRGFAGLFGR